MSARIRSHITVLRSVPEPDAVAAVLSGGRPHRACRVKVGEARRAEPIQTGGIYLVVDDPHGDLDRLRALLRPACQSDPDAVQELAHVTLVHPRTTTPEHRDRAWETVRDWKFIEDVTVCSLELIGENDQGWSVISSFALAAA